MKLKSLLSSLTACAVALTLSAPTLAASGFSDVQDPVTSVHVNVLQLLGAVSGSGNNYFSPNANLTRAEFCVMAINIMGKADQVPLYTTRTIFQDVTARHWARGFVNLAASTTIGTAADSNPASRLISGVGNGNFQPDAPITYAQAVTILMRMLGYSDAQAGTVWPAGYLNLAKSLSLTDGLSLSPNAPITRAQAAQLFVNLLSANAVSGSPYYSTLGTAKKDVILLAVNVAAEDHTPGAIRTSVGTFLPAKDGIIPSSLLGKRGTLILNDHNEIITFLPDDSTNTVITLSGNAKANGLTSTDGTCYSISPSTPVYTGTAASTYADTWLDLYSGAQVTLFFDGGKIIGVFHYQSSSAANSTMVLLGKPSYAAFYSLTGGRENYTIQKNHQTISMGDIKPYDVVTYDSVQNTLIVSDLRLTCVYESAAPNSASPATVHALGHDFPVLDCALDSVTDFAVGSTVTMLLTADGCVAKFLAPSHAMQNTALGFSGNSSVDMFLPSGGTIRLSSSQALSNYAQNQVVTISSGKSGVISASPLSPRAISDRFDLTNMTLGKHSVSTRVRIFEKLNDSAAVPIALSDLNMSTIPADKIASYHLNSSDVIDIIILNSFTGNAYEYGRYTVVTDDYTNPETGITTSTNTSYFTTAQGGKIKLNNSLSVSYGKFVGVVLKDNSQGEKRVISFVPLTRIDNISRSDFFLSQDNYYVTVNGITYPVSADVNAYNTTTEQWFTGNNVLSSVRAYSDEMTLYIDPIGQQVRIITTK